MNFLNVDIPVKNVPELDKGFVPLGLFFKNYQKGAAKPLCIAVERSGGQIGTYETKIYGTPEMEQADAYYVDRLVKFLLWSWGGFKVSICGDDNVAAAIRAAYSEGGSRAFDKGFMEQVYETEFIVESLPYDKKPEAVQRAESIGRHLDGGRIGFDAGGSDRKVSAVLDGEPIYSEEVVWFPKTISNPDYHFEGIMAALSTAAAKILEKGGHVDAIGVSSAGVYIDNKCMVASLFLKVGKDEFDKKVKNIYTRAAEQLSSQLGYHIPVVVANDGDVTALVVQPQVIGEVRGGRPAPRKADQPEERIACDVVLMAVGQVVDSKSFAQAGVPTDHNNIVTADDGSVPGLEGVFSGGDCVSGPATVILAIEAGKVAAASIDEYLGFHTDISANLDIPPAPFRLKHATGRVDLTEREANWRKNDFELMENCMSEQEMAQECSRCLRCDHYGHAGFKGGRLIKW